MLNRILTVSTNKVRVHDCTSRFICGCTVHVVGREFVAHCLRSGHWRRITVRTAIAHLIRICVAAENICFYYRNKIRIYCLQRPLTPHCSCDATGHCSTVSVYRTQNCRVPRHFGLASGPCETVPRPLPFHVASLTFYRILQLRGVGEKLQK